MRIVQGVAMRRVAVRLLAGLFAVGWLVFPGFGAIDLSVTWDADWPQVLEAGWGLFFTVIVGAAFALVALRPRRPSGRGATRGSNGGPCGGTRQLWPERTSSLRSLLSSRCRRRCWVGCSGSLKRETR